MAESKAYFNTIYVIEALRDGDLHTGRKLFEDLEFMALAAQPEVNAHFVQIKTAAEFIQVLESIHANARNGERPLLHIETHGDGNGIQISSGESLSWSSLQK